MNRLIPRAAALLALSAPLAAVAGQPFEVEIFDRAAGRNLPVYWHDGERYVAGEPGHRYEVRVRNRAGGRVLAVTSVDGVNVISGETAAPDQTGYVLDGNGSVHIDGWRKSMAQVAAFYFTALPDSYAARTGRPDNVGVIGVALFRERARPTYFAPQDSVARADAESLPLPSTPDARAKRERLGTGHGERLDSSVTTDDFERASATPDSVIRIFYDSRRNLVAQGVIPRRYHARTGPNPFPAGFVPDP